jgi:spoIIIJ-associated protein
MEETKDNVHGDNKITEPAPETNEAPVSPEIPAAAEIAGTQEVTAPIPTEPLTPEKIESEVQTIVENIVAYMGIRSMVRCKYTEDIYYTNIRSRGSDGLLIGKRGMTAQSIQSLVNQIMRHRHPDMYIDVFVDISGYRKRHENFLKKKALAVAKVVEQTKRDMALDILTEREFKMVEKELTPLGTVRIHAIGSGFRKTVIISPLSIS